MYVMYGKIIKEAERNIHENQRNSKDILDLSRTHKQNIGKQTGGSEEHWKNNLKDCLETQQMKNNNKAFVRSLEICQSYV